MIHKLTAKKLPAILFALALILGMVPMGACAAADEGEIESVPASGVTLTFSDSGVTAGGAEGGYKIEGTALQINESGVYTITGACAEGSITVKKGTTGVTLILQDLMLGCSTTAPLASNKGTETTLYIVGTVTLNDNERLENEDSDDFEGAAIKLKSEGSRLTIRGDGTLNVNGGCKNGIKGAATADIVIESGTINVTAANNGIASDNSLTINGGTLNITAGNEGLKSSPDDDDSDSLGNLAINGGVINVTAADDGVHADGDLTITGGTITVSAGDDAFHADGVLTVDGGDITVTESYEGLEGASVYLNGGSGKITASDDGVNAADDNNGTVTVEINGGTWYVNAGGDGIDAGGNANRGNGTIVFNGGVTEVYGASNSGNTALDSESGITCNGGTVLAVGMSGMIDLPAAGVYVAFGPTGGMMGGGFPGGGRQGGFPGGRMPDDRMQAADSGSAFTIAKGTGIAIKDSGGATLYSAVGVKNANHVIFASEGLTDGAAYTLFLDGEEAATATAAAGTGFSNGFGGGMRGGMRGPENMPQGQIPPQAGGAPATGFADVAPDAYYAAAVAWAKETGVTDGKTDTTFGPADPLTRAQVMTFLWRAKGCPEPESSVNIFTDVEEGEYYTKAVLWAAKQGITDGIDDDLFGTKNGVTQAQMLAFLFRALGGTTAGGDWAALALSSRASGSSRSTNVNSPASLRAHSWAWRGMCTRMCSCSGPATRGAKWQTTSAVARACASWRRKAYTRWPDVVSPGSRP